MRIILSWDLLKINHSPQSRKIIVQHKKYIKIICIELNELGVLYSVNYNSSILIKTSDVLSAYLDGTRYE